MEPNYSVPASNEFPLILPATSRVIVSTSSIVQRRQTHPRFLAIPKMDSVSSMYFKYANSWASKCVCGLRQNFSSTLPTKRTPFQSYFPSITTKICILYCSGMSQPIHNILWPTSHLTYRDAWKYLVKADAEKDVLQTVIFGTKTASDVTGRNQRTCIR